MIGLIIFALVVGIPLYLLFEHPVVFWIVLVPIAVYVIIKFITWLKK